MESRSWNYSAKSSSTADSPPPRRCQVIPSQASALRCSGESSLGVRLIERTTRHLRLTDAGDTIFRAQPPFAVPTALADL